MFSEDINKIQRKSITKRFWTYINSKRKDTSGISVLRDSNGNEITDATQKANILNEQYNSVFTDEDPTLPTLGPCQIPAMPNITINTNGINKLLTGLNPAKASGPDLIPTRVLKECSDIISPYLQIIFQQSIDAGTAPSDWKHANVSAIYKKGRRDEAVNYRPVSLTSVPCKIMEHIIFHHVMDHFDLHNILANHQHGFRAKHSCETQLVNTIEQIARALDNNKQTDLLVLDFSKAFDTVAHERLLLKLNHYGIRGNNLSWFRSWLVGRSQQVVLDGESSTRTPVKSGVPQGTVLGPLCFLVYINDMGSDLSTTTSLKLFADDSLLFMSVENQQDALTLQDDLDKLVSWANTWQMKFHPSKCYVLSIHRRKSPITHKYTMLGEELKSVTHIPYLGIEITNNLNWTTHIQTVVSKSNKVLGFLRRNLHQCPENIKAQAYKSLVRPNLEYASAAWDPYRQKDINMLEQVQRRAARFVTKCHSREPGCVTQALQHLQWESLQSRREASRLSLFYKGTHNLAAITIPTYFSPQTNTNTRQFHPSKFIQPAARTDGYKFSYFPRTIVKWNTLPSDILDSDSLSSFKSSVSKQLNN